MSQHNFMVLDTGNLLASNKSRTYQNLVKSFVKVFVGFLQDNSLVAKQLLGADEPVTADLIIRQSDLTEEGYMLVEAAFYKWLNAVDRGRIEVADVTILQKALEKIRKKSK